jgi:hypothetical protein
VLERKEGTTYDHDVEDNHDHAFHPIGLSVRRDVVDQEACSDDGRDFPQIYIRRN